MLNAVGVHYTRPPSTFRWGSGGWWPSSKAGLCIAGLVAEAPLFEFSPEAATTPALISRAVHHLRLLGLATYFSSPCMTTVALAGPAGALVMAQQEAGKTVNVVGDAPTYDRTSMLGNLLEEYEEDSMPLLWFNGIGEFWFWLIVSSHPIAQLT